MDKIQSDKLTVRAIIAVPNLYILTPIYNNIRTLYVAGPIMIFISFQQYRTVALCTNSALHNDLSIQLPCNSISDAQFLLDYREDNVILKIF